MRTATTIKITKRVEMSLIVLNIVAIICNIVGVSLCLARGNFSFHNIRFELFSTVLCTLYLLWSKNEILDVVRVPFDGQKNRRKMSVENYTSYEMSKFFANVSDKTIALTKDYTIIHVWEFKKKYIWSSVAWNLVKSSSQPIEDTDNQIEAWAYTFGGKMECENNSKLYANYTRNKKFGL